MAAKGPSPLWLFLVLLSWMVLWSEASSDFQSFKHEYVDYPRTAVGDYCNYLLKKRGLASTMTHTFIHVSDKDFKNICTVVGVKETGPMSSPSPVPVTSCFKYDYSYHPFYVTRKISLSCEKGYPIELRF